MFKIDQAHDKIDIFASRMTRDIWTNKYRWKDEPTPLHTFRRVADAVAKVKDKYNLTDDERALSDKFFNAMRQGLWLPGGRIFAGAGTDKRVTLMNCYVNTKVGDSMEGITHALTNTMLTLQQGGGIGTDFSTLRPEGALLTRTQSKASGPIPFMHTWDAASRTIRSAGDRRGAMMGTMSDTHPDLIKFIEAKRTKGALEQFNVSILVSDALMEAVKEGEDWLFYFPIPPVSRAAGLEDLDFEDDVTGEKQYVYNVIPARELWEIITRNTYEYSEPGVIFIDRVNELNNLHYCEDIRCTNPCGEQPLPPHGTCNLGHVNLARCVKNPFTDDAEIDHELIREITKLGVQFLDNVIDITQYPLPEQETEERNKRRLGLGFTGLADMLAQLKTRYGSPNAVRITDEVTRTMCIAAYEQSIELARTLGHFPSYTEQYLAGYSFVNTILPPHIREKIAEHGIRNSLLMTVAPTGTGSILYGNVSSGCEPVFMHYSQRRVLKPSDGFKDEWENYVEWGYGAQLYFARQGLTTETINNLGAVASLDQLPSYMVTVNDLSVQDHVVMQAAGQRNIDASISKTVNVPEDMPYEEFVKVYELAYSLGCKGCTTYRPSEVRGSILAAPGATQPVGVQTTLPKRPDVLSGFTYKLDWPTLDSALYLTINHNADDQPLELFINSKDSRYHDWTTALTTMISAIWRQSNMNGSNASFVATELQQVQSLNDGAFKDQKHHPSLVAYIGHMLEKHINGSKAESTSVQKTAAPRNVLRIAGSTCPKCKQPTLIKEEGCKKCTTCSYSTCG